jgi:RNA polymerase primary sigma factor
MFEAADHRSDEHRSESDYLHNREAVQGMLGRLDDRERRILVSRYGIGGANELTLERLGRELGITKERVRQIQSQAQEKLREFALSAKDFLRGRSRCSHHSSLTCWLVACSSL